MAALTLFEKLWRSHEVVAETPDTPAVLYIDLHLTHEVTSPQAFSVLRERGLAVRRRDRTLATLDHSTPTDTAQVFGGYRAKKVRVGAQYSYQQRKAAAGSTAKDLDLDIVSAFGVFDFKPNKASVFLRVDRYADACPDCSGIDYLPISSVTPFTLGMAGLEVYLLPSVRFSPNVQYVTYSTPEAAGVSPPVPGRRSGRARRGSRSCRAPFPSSCRRSSSATFRSTSRRSRSSFRRGPGT